MPVLNAEDIKEELKKGELVIKPLTEDQIGPASVDLRIGNQFRIFRRSEITSIDLKKDMDLEIMELVEKPDDKPFVIHPGQLIISNTMEYVKMPVHLAGRLDGRLKWGKLGIVIQSASGYIQPGYEGQLTLSITNTAPVPIKLWPGLKVCQLILRTVGCSADK